MKIWRYDLPNINRQGWAIVVMCEDGYFSAVSDYGDYAHKWPREKGDFREFIMQIADRKEVGYLLGKIAETKYDGEATCKAVQEYIMEIRRDGSFTKEEAQEEWALVTECDCLDNEPSFTRFYDRTKIDDVCELIVNSYSCHALAFAKETMPRLAEMIKAELESENNDKK